LVHIQTLDLACRRQQVSEGHFARIEEVPGQALTLSIPAILKAKVISCVVPDRRKAEAVRGALEGPLTPDCPASALRQHSNCRLHLDVPSASLLSPPASAHSGSAA
jgi:glucosamine-6-phosphate deaminase